MDQRYLADDHPLDEDVVDEFVAEALRIDAEIGQKGFVPALLQFGAGVVAMHQNAIDVEEDSARHLGRLATIAPRPASTSAGMLSS